MASSSPTMYLRVKRPRHVALPSILCVDLDSSKKRAKTVDHLASLLHQSTYIQQQQHIHSTVNNSTAIWKRVDNNEAHQSNNNKRSFHFVNAVLDNVEQQQNEEGVYGPRASKRRRRLALTLLQDRDAFTTIPKELHTNKTQQQKRKHIILDPRSRLVQDSLQQVLAGERSVQQHVSFLTQDSRLCETPRVWLAWQDTSSGNNILHAASRWNNVDGASLLVQSWKVPSLFTAVNDDGHTPYQVAVAVGHDNVAQVLKLANGKEKENDSDDSDFVYDVFQLDSEMNNVETTINHDDDEHDTLTSVELRGGIGYWNEQGNLILEALEEMGDYSDSQEEDDEDSNAEDYYQHDYPDEEQVWQDDSDEEEEVSFRHRPIYLDSPNAQIQQMRHSLVEDEDEEYDAQYDMYEPSGPDRLYAYDAELEETSDDD